MQLSFSKILLTLPVFVAKVLMYMLELRIDLKDVAEANPDWDTWFHMEKKEVKNLRLREQVSETVNTCISH